MEISQEEKSRIEAKAIEVVNDGTFGYPDDKTGQWMFDKLKDEFIKGAEYERTIANTQLSEKDKEINELREYKRLNTIGLSGYTTEELHKEIEALKQALGDAVDRMKRAQRILRKYPDEDSWHMLDTDKIENLLK